MKKEKVELYYKKVLIQMPLGTEYQLQLKILIFRAKFIQK